MSIDNVTWFSLLECNAVATRFESGCAFTHRPCVRSIVRKYALYEHRLTQCCITEPQYGFPGRAESAGTSANDSGS